MKYIIAILLIVTVAIQTFSKWVVILAYEANKDYIASNLCVNRAKPSSCCKGKCFLKKKLISDDNQEQPAGKLTFQDSQVDLYLQRNTQAGFLLPVCINKHNSFYLNGKPQDYSFSFFQPPQCNVPPII